MTHNELAHAYLGAGWMYSECLKQVLMGKDLGEINVKKIIKKMENDLFGRNFELKDEMN